jgi:glycosyltransferase involved in cell wall biosynthesis
VRLYIVGISNRSTDWYTAIPVPEACKPYPRYVPWLRQIMAEMDLAVAPLVDDAFNAAKSDLKFLEYAAGGLATVASDVPAYRDSISHGETGLLARNTCDDWTANLRQLLSDAQTRQRLADNARAYVSNARLVGHRVSALDRAVACTVSARAERL